jgi:hypothetical protein
MRTREVARFGDASMMSGRDDYQGAPTNEIFLLSRACARVRVKKSTNIALEGLDIIFPTFAPYVLPFSVLILVVLFAVQPQGTARLGRAFGPIMALWFATIAVLGIWGISILRCFLRSTPGMGSAIFSPAEVVDFSSSEGSSCA